MISYFIVVGAMALLAFAGLFIAPLFGSTWSYGSRGWRIEGAALNLLGASIALAALGGAVALLRLL